MGRYILFLIILLSFYACHKESVYEFVSKNESEYIADVFADIDTKAYDSLVVRKDFQYIVRLYKENRDAIYSCAEEQLPEEYLKSDTIRSLVQYCAKRLDCPNFALYIAKYIESEEEVATKCIANEPVYSCWNRAWDYYEGKYPNLVYSRVKDVYAVKKELYVRVGGGLPCSFVLDHVLLKGNRIVRFTNEQDLYNHLLWLGIPKMSEREVHVMNRTLYDHFYSYYISGDWKITGGEKTNAELGEVCPKCNCNPCICDKICPECHMPYKECICCEVCDQFPCICVPALGKTEYEAEVNGLWRSLDVRPYLIDYCKTRSCPTVFNMRFIWQDWEREPVCVFESRVAEKEPYHIPEFIHTESMEMALAAAYVIYTDLEYFPDLKDVYSFVRMIKILYDEAKKAGILPEMMRKCYMGFWLTPYETYVFASGGKLGLLDEYWEHVDINDIEKGFCDFMTGIYDTELTTNPHQSFSSLSETELLLYRCTAYFQKIGCDVEIYRWDEREGIYGSFVKPWRYEK